MKLPLLITFVFFTGTVLYAQEVDTTALKSLQDTVVRALSSDLKTSVDSLSESSIDGMSIVQDTIKKNETRQERRARKKAEKEHDRLYYKGIKKDSARLEIERVSRIAWQRSIFVPGWGQYTNGGLWWIKVPIIYGGFVTSFLVFDFWQWYYKKFLNEITYRMENNGDRRDPDLQFFDSMDGMIKQKDYARRNRDLTILATVGWYGLNVVEAYVNSMLKNRWSIGDEVAVKVSPSLIVGMPPTTINHGFGNMLTPGLKLTLSLH
ncbi:MAG TPA: DUF5683 domain-containing protein [Sphingobacterium sp.]|nr:DUF5683 domain-containing protein [Sphingobacterium sp.]